MQSAPCSVKGQTALQRYRNEPFFCSGYSEHPAQLRLVEHKVQSMSKHPSVYRRAVFRGLHAVLQLPPRASLSKLVSLDCRKGTCPSFLLRAFTVCSRKVRDLLMALASYTCTRKNDKMRRRVKSSAHDTEGNCCGFVEQESLL